MKASRSGGGRRRKAGGHIVVTDVEGALRRETRQRRQAERVARRQSEALAKTLDLLVRAPALPDFIRALLRSIMNECGGLWTTFWTYDEQTGDGSRASVQWRDEGVGRSVETFVRKHPQLMRRLGHVYRDLIRSEGVTLLVPPKDRRVSPAVRKFYRSIGATGALLVPMKLGRRLIGWITHQGGSTTHAPEQVAFVEAMAQQAALAIYLTRLDEAKHAAECALDEERQAREHQQELATISRLLQVTAHDPADRLGSVLRVLLSNTAKLLRGRWASLWRMDDAAGFAVPAWVATAADCERVPADEAKRIAMNGGSLNRNRFEKWLAKGDVHIECAGAKGVREMLARVGAPAPAGRCAKTVFVPLRFDEDLLGFLLVLTEDAPDPAGDRLMAVRALAMQAALTLALGDMASVQRSAALAEERNRIARDLHDLLAQSFTGIVLQVEAMRAECQGLPEIVATRLEKIRTQAGRSAEELRRTLLMLRPTALDQCSLPEALALLARDTESRTGVRVRFRNRIGNLRLVPRAEQHLLAIATESLQNALFHGAPTQISMQFEVVRGLLVLRVINDGSRPVPGGAARAGHGLGLSNLRERATEIGAQLHMRTRRGRTRVELSAPVEKVSANGI